MAPKKPFKVIIAGGGVAGLTLAAMLEKFDIDYVLLEAHQEFYPDVGASIGLMANGLRILDQLGIYERILKLPPAVLKRTTIRGPKGEVLLEVPNHAQHTQKRFGYSVIFFDRQWLLHALYDAITHKERLLPKQKVARVEMQMQMQMQPHGVSVTTECGDVFHGDMLVGADGVHSAVRAEMFRLGNQLQPGYFAPGEPDRVPCYYQCSYGIAQNVPGWIDGDVTYTTGDGGSLLIITGPESRVYWFVFRRLPEPKFGSDIPRYSDEDEVQFRQAHRHVTVTDKVTMGDIFDKRLRSVLTPLHEVVYKKWFFQRIFILGDAAHKPNPLAGQGGNGAMESAAELVNSLLRRRDEKGASSLSDLTSRDIEQLFAEAQAARHQRAHDRVDEAHQMQALYAFESPLQSKLVLSWLSLVGSPETIDSRQDRAILGASRLEKLPVPYHSHILPWTDETKAKPIGGAGPKACNAAFASVFFALSVFAWRAGLENTLALGSWSTSDRGIGARLELLSTMSQLVAPLVVYTIEANRVANTMTPLSLAGLATTGMSLKGAGVVGCFHSLVATLQGGWVPTMRFTPPHAVRSVLSSIAATYLLPLAALCFSRGNTDAAASRMIACAPPLFSAVSYATSKVIRWWSIKDKDELRREDPAFERYTTKDVPILQSVYLWTGVLQASAYMASSAYLGLYPNQATTTCTIPSIIGFFKSVWCGHGLGAAAAHLLKSDMAVAALSWFGGNMYTIWDLRKLGYIKTSETLKAAALTTIGQAVVGPGATWMAVAHWREGVMASMSRT
ncbi:FAD binding domain protein [Apiospora sp. TS-2023a]